MTTYIVTLLSISIDIIELHTISDHQNCIDDTFITNISLHSMITNNIQSMTLYILHVIQNDHEHLQEPNNNR